MMRRLVPLVVTLRSLACGNEPTSPSSSLELPTGPPLPTGVPNGSPVTMRGELWDTTHLPISGAQVQVVAPSRSPVAVTDGNGQFLMPWPFTGTVTVRASKQGFHAREYSVPEPGAPRYPVHLAFELEAIDAPVIVPGCTTSHLPPPTSARSFRPSRGGECTGLRCPRRIVLGARAWPVLRDNLQYRAY